MIQHQVQLVKLATGAAVSAFATQKNVLWQSEGRQWSQRPHYQGCPIPPYSLAWGELGLVTAAKKRVYRRLSMRLFRGLPQDTKT